MNAAELLIETVPAGALREIVVAFLDSSGAARDLSLATGLKIRLEGPDGTSQEFTASDVALDTDGLDGAIKATVEAADTTSPGLYKVQGFATVSGRPIQTLVGSFWAQENTAEVEEA